MKATRGNIDCWEGMANRLIREPENLPEAEFANKESVYI